MPMHDAVASAFWRSHRRSSPQLRARAVHARAQSSGAATPPSPRRPARASASTVCAVPARPRPILADEVRGADFQPGAGQGDLPRASPSSLGGRGSPSRLIADLYQLRSTRRASCPSGGSRVRRIWAAARARISTSRFASCRRPLWEETARNSTASRRSRPRAAGGRACAPSASSSPTPTTRASRRRRRPRLLQLLTDDSEKIRRYAAAATSRIGGGDADELLLSLLRTGASVRERESARRRRWPMLARTTPLRPRWRSWRARPTLYTSGPSRRCATRARSQRRRLARRDNASRQRASMCSRTPLPAGFHGPQRHPQFPLDTV